MNKPFNLNPVWIAFKRAGAETVYNDLVAPFFKLSKSRAFVAALVASNVGIVGTGIYLNNLFGKFIDHLNIHNASAFKGDIKAFCLCAAVSAAFWAIRSFSSDAMQLSWRDWARTKMVGLICSPDRRGGFTHTSNGEKSQTGQRVVEDVANMVGLSSYLAMDGLRSASDIVAFSVVLYALSPSVWASVSGLSVAGIVVANLWSKKMRRIDDDINRYTNNFRNAVVETVGKKEAIEMWRGEDAEVEGLKEKLLKQTQSVRERIYLNLQLAAWNSFIGSASRLAPYGIAGQDVLDPSTNTSIGKLTEIAGASGYLTNGTLWFLNVVPQANYLVAVSRRLETFLIQSKMSIPDTQAPHYQAGLSVGVHIRRLAVAPRGRAPLCESIELDLRAGDRIALTGASGCGKTTLLRQLAGVTPILNGSITYVGLDGAGEALFVPQETHVPDLSLPEVLSYPKPGVVFKNEEMMGVLEEVGLANFIHCLKDTEKTGATFAQEMSGGEKQRLNFARLLLHKPKVIGLDEATSSLPRDDGIAMYDLLIRNLPESIIISTVHRPELIQHHTLLGAIDGGRWILSAVPKLRIPEQNKIMRPEPQV